MTRRPAPADPVSGMWKVGTSVTVSRPPEAATWGAEAGSGSVTVPSAATSNLTAVARSLVPWRGDRLSEPVGARRDARDLEGPRAVGDR